MNEVIVLFDGYSKKLDQNRMDANCTSTIIKGPKFIIVDTMTAWDREKIVEALAQEGIKPADIDYVVCTHSHADHIGNNNLFTNAEHIVGAQVQQRTIFYENKFENGEYHISNGVKVIATPGHTAEDVTVLVKTEINDKSVTYGITGDLFEKEEDIVNPTIWKDLGLPELRHIQAKNRSYVINAVDFIIPGHGPKFAITNSARRLVQDELEKNTQHDH
ncbi:metallo-beta-lactamase domain-containing protein 1 [Orussus abietinus]|uniref:metallo-beta-lactamase domain-containing protein 1 n=1 Tax=Orussus abietinus TaxID=222816 RepID=UPI000624FD15|nr:metallo-beta-lactamase domain-containing protein 1 [Orussus abietinus]